MHEGTENMSYFFYKIIIFRLNKEKGEIRSAHVYYYFLNEPVISHNLETAKHIAYVIFVLHNAMKTQL